MRRAVMVWLVVALALCPGATAVAQWSERPFSYVAVGQDVREILRDFAASQGLGILISPKVTGTISGTFQEMQPRAFITELAATTGFVWYLFGGVLFIYDTSEIESQILHIDNTPPELLQRALADLGILDPRFGWKVEPGLGIVLVSGPPQYTKLVKEIVETVEARRSAAPAVEVFRLQHASAVDRTISYRDQQITVPGVTSILRQLVGAGGRGGVQQRQLPATVPPLPGLRGQGLAAQGTATPTPPATTAAGGQAPPAQAAADPSQMVADPLGAADLVTIESDPRLNAVIVSARSDRLPFFRRLIQQLDTPSQLIQIDVTIMDVAANRLTELGIQWEFNAGDFGGGVSSVITPTIEAGLGITGLGSDFKFEFRALETDGDARIVSQPSVLTFDSVEAVIDETESIYIRVPGNEDVDLFQVQTGTLLRVTPRIVTARTEPGVELFVDIRDGDFDQDMEVDQIPAVLESQLTTTAIVGGGEALLLGGLYRTLSQNVDEKVPLLGDIPVLGLAFRSKRTQQTSAVRLFLLTPRIIELGAEAGDRIELTPPTAAPPLVRAAPATTATTTIPATPAPGASTGAAPRPSPRAPRRPKGPMPLLPPAGKPVPQRATTAPCQASTGRSIPETVTYASVVSRLGCRPAAGGGGSRPRRTTTHLPALY